MWTQGNARRQARPSTHRGLLAAGLPAVLLAAGVASAQTYDYQFQIGGGHLTAPNNVVVDSLTRNVFVTDGAAAADDVAVFDAAGNYLSAFGGPGAGNGQMSYPTGLRVDVGYGHVLVADYYNTRVQVFARDGTYLSQFGNTVFTEPCDIAVDPVTHNIVVSDGYGARVFVFSASGTLIRQFGSAGTGPGQFTYACGINIDPQTSHILVDDEINDNVQIFSSTGVYLGQFGSAGSGNGQMSSPGGIAIDPITRNIVVADYNNNRVDVFSPSGVYLTQFGSPGEGNGHFDGPDGLDIDGVTDTVYVADRGHASVQAFSPEASCGPTPVGLSIEPLTARLSQSVLFSATASIHQPFAGTVSFNVDGGGAACTANMQDITATCLHPLELGTHSIVAQYSGDGLNPPGCSAPQPVTIVADGNGTMTGLGCLSLPDPAIEGQPVQVVCTLSAGQLNPMLADGTAASGYVTYAQGGVVLAYIPLSFGTSTYTNALAGGSYPITATYSGDAANDSSSADITVVVTTPDDDIFFGGFEIPPG